MFYVRGIFRVCLGVGPQIFTFLDFFLQSYPVTGSSQFEANCHMVTSPHLEKVRGSVGESVLGPTSQVPPIPLPSPPPTPHHTSPLTPYTFPHLSIPTSVPSNVRNLRKMRNFGQNFSIFAHCYYDLKANSLKVLKYFFWVKCSDVPMPVFTHLTDADQRWPEPRINRSRTDPDPTKKDPDPMRILNFCNFRSRSDTDPPVHSYSTL